LINDADVTSAVATSLNTSSNVLILTADYFDNALALSTATTLFADCDTGDLLIIYAASASGNARVAVATLNVGGDVTAATDVAILVGLTITEASTGFTTTNFILD
jgi:hypothetical protein